MSVALYFSHPDPSFQAKSTGISSHSITTPSLPLLLLDMFSPFCLEKSSPQSSEASSFLSSNSYTCHLFRGMT